MTQNGLLVCEKASTESKTKIKHTIAFIYGTLKKILHIYEK
jgi:hypothetical protein